MTTFWELEHSRLLNHATANGRCEDCNAKPPNHEEPTALAYTPDDEMEAGYRRFREQFPEAAKAWDQFVKGDE